MAARTTSGENLKKEDPPAAVSKPAPTTLASKALSLLEASDSEASDVESNAKGKYKSTGNSNFSVGKKTFQGSGGARNAMSALMDSDDDDDRNTSNISTSRSKFSSVSSTKSSTLTASKGTGKQKPMDEDTVMDFDADFDDD